ncbi:MAG: Gram-negative bacterial TonB protein C-terminal [Planctomycetota bacterium]
MASWLERLGVHARPPDQRPRAEVEQDIEDELRFHLEERSAELRSGGFDAAAAAGEASRLFGDYDQVRAECARIQLGERIMMQRFQMLATVLLLLAVGWLAYEGVASRKDVRAQAEANTRLLATLERLETRLSPVVGGMPAVDRKPAVPAPAVDRKQVAWTAGTLEDAGRAAIRGKKLVLAVFASGALAEPGGAIHAVLAAPDVRDALGSYETVLLRLDDPTQGDAHRRLMETTAGPKVDPAFMVYQPRTGTSLRAVEGLPTARMLAKFLLADARWSAGIVVGGPDFGQDMRALGYSGDEGPAIVEPAAPRAAPIDRKGFVHAGRIDATRMHPGLDFLDVAIGDLPATPLDPLDCPGFVAAAQGREVVLRFRVDAAGAVQDPEVVSSGGGPLDLVALECLKAWRFSPARRGELLVPAMLEVRLPAALAKSR